MVFWLFPSSSTLPRLAWGVGALGALNVRLVRMLLLDWVAASGPSSLMGLSPLRAAERVVVMIDDQLGLFDTEMNASELNITRKMTSRFCLQKESTKVDV